MNKRADFSNLGGFPLEQDTLEFMQQSYRGAFGALAGLCGNKTILVGVELVAGNYSNGWISYNGELIPFVGAVAAPDVVIVETPATVQAVFEDGTPRDVYFTKLATCGSAGVFPMADLVPITSLKFAWKKDDLRMAKKSNAYIAANFDATTGIGTTAEERGWQILSKQDINAAGKTFVNIDSADTDFDTAGKIIGEKAHTQTEAELVPHVHNYIKVQTQGSGTTSGYVNGQSQGNVGKNTESTGGGQPFNIIQPSYAILTLIKL